LLPIIAEATGADLSSLGSTTFSREDLQRGFEPDSCFYVQNEAMVRGKARIDLHVDPPPDLVFEVDITHSTLDKLAIYAQIGVPEVWRYNGERFQVMILTGDHYNEQSKSQAFPLASAAALAWLFRDSIMLSNMAWIRRRPRLGAGPGAERHHLTPPGSQVPEIAAHPCQTCPILYPQTPIPPW